MGNMTTGTAQAFWDSEEGQTFLRKWDMLVAAICTVRDHPQATSAIRGKADICEGLAQNLKMSLHKALDKRN
jgi:hypothetical protein